MRAPPTLYTVVVVDGKYQLTSPSAAACSVTMMIRPEEPHHASRSLLFLANIHE
jgi:hypothetical protein